MVLDPAESTAGSLREIELNLIHKAPAPVFAPFERAHDRVLGFMKMLSGVTVLRRIATAYFSANHAEAKVHPLVADFQAFLAAFGVRMDVLDLAEMLARFHVRIIPQS
jgi:hypothetical protein